MTNTCIALVADWSECIDEVRVEVDLSCHLGFDNTSVDVSFETRLFAGTGCANTDLDGTQQREFLAPMCGASCALLPIDLTVSNDAEKGDDKGVFHLQVTNLQR